jgi:hypothetical protein
MKIFYTLLILLFAVTVARSQSVADNRSSAGKILKFYPNPATSVINFDFQKDSDQSYNLKNFSFLGKKVFEVEKVTPKTTVNLNDFYRGVYIFQLRDRNGKVVDSGKFQVSK